MSVCRHVKVVFLTIVLCSFNRSFWNLTTTIFATEEMHRSILEILAIPGLIVQNNGLIVVVSKNSPGLVLYSLFIHIPKNAVKH